MASADTRAFYTLDADLKIVAASPNTLRIWGKSSKDVFGRRLVELFPWVEGGPVHEALEDALRSFQPKRLRVNSVILGQLVEVEVYPVSGGLQVSFTPVA